MTNPAEYITGRTVQEQMNQLISYVDTRATEVASGYADAARTSAEAAAASADAAANTLANAVTLTGAQTISGNKTLSGANGVTGSLTVPTIATGTNDTKAANGTKVINELDAYSPMVRTTGAQTIAGVKTISSGSIVGVVTAGGSSVFKTKTLADATASVAPANYDCGSIDFLDTNGTTVARISLVQLAGSTAFRINLWILNSDNTWTIAALATGS